MNQRSKKIDQIIASLSDSKVENLELVQEVRQSFLDYAMSVITARSLADVRDGLKPIHRRILYTAMIEGQTSDKRYKKSANLVGKIMGSFHPHGDSSIYEALVRLAQDFSMRYPLIAGQGNFGSIDGDSPAAMRYTEAKLSKIGDLFLQHIKEDTVDFIPNYDGTQLEPTVLPTPIPNILINGVQGIAVGVATNIPPHNLTEVCDGILAVLNNPNLSDQQLNQIILGPDFPTGGEIHDTDGIKNYLATGSGKFYNRAKVRIVKGDNNQNDYLLVEEIPYNLKKSNLIDKIVKLAKPTKNDLLVKAIAGQISDIRDESNREGIRLIIEVKKGTNPYLLLNALYQHSPLQTCFSANLTTLVDRSPVVLGVLAIIKLYIKHQLDVLLRQARFNLNKLQQRIHLLEGRTIIADDLLEVVKIISQADQPEEQLAAKYHLTPPQIEDIFQQPLKAIKKLERQKLVTELENSQNSYQKLLVFIGSEQQQKAAIADQLTKIKKDFGDNRRTVIFRNSPGKINYETLIPQEDIVITLSVKNYLKRTSLAAYKTHRHGGVGVVGGKTYEDDQIKMALICCSHDHLWFFTNQGKVYTTKAYALTEGDRNTKGKPATMIFSRLAADEKIITILVVPKSDTGSLVFATKNGLIKKTPVKAYLSINVLGKLAIKIRPDDQLLFVQYLADGGDVLLAAASGRLVWFGGEQVRNMGRNSYGVLGIKLSNNQPLVSLATSSDRGDYVFAISTNGIGKLSQLTDFRLTKRGAKGIIAQRINNRTGPLLTCFPVNKTEDIFLLTNKGKINRFTINTFLAKGRNTSGVKLFQLQDDEQVIYATKYFPSNPPFPKD